MFSFRTILAKLNMNYCQTITLFSQLFSITHIWAQNNANSDSLVNVKIDNQNFIGTKSVVSEQKVSSFISIPYAEPPIGELRFKKPLPINAKTDGLVNATQWRSCCPQERDCREFSTSDQSEDCLYLNIWTPTHEFSEVALKPVMLHIHGGNWLFGESQDGSVLSANSDVVVVTINYRIGFLGFLYAQNEEFSPGNAGLWDQALALEWVNKNIEYFGGDPQRITLFGGTSVSIHVLSPLTRNLFKNVIVMSGSSLSRLSHSEPKVVFNTSLVFSNLVGCNDAKHTYFSKEIIDCLRGLSTKQIIDGQLSRQLWTHIFGFSSNYIHGDQLLPKHPNGMLNSGDYKKNISLMISTTNDEGSSIMNRMDPIRYSNDNPVNLTYSEAYLELKQFINSMVNSPAVDEKVAKLYFKNYDLTKSSSSSEFLQTIAVAIGDFFVACPSIKFAKAIAFNDSDSESNKIYELYWTSKLSDSDAIFGLPFLKQSSEIEKQVSLKLMNIYAYFAKHDRPPKQDDTEWLSFQILKGSKITPFYKLWETGGYYGNSMKEDECEIWNHYF